MDDETAERIIEKADFVKECVAILADYQPMGREEYIADQTARDVVERRFVKAIQACIDIAGMILRDEGNAVPDSSAERVRKLTTLGIVPETVGEEIAAAVGFRNVLAHRYDNDIHHEDVYESLQNLARFRRYLVAIRDHLDTRGALD
ncbi:MAG: DUF86 domain-containing protein [Euryarchaeota archaeon]|nr:DUF86 domain-containing protein [Euryarchaeota archaeon]